MVIANGAQQIMNRATTKRKVFVILACSGVPFLDTINTRSDAQIQVNVYRKPIHPDRYLDFHSHHPLCQKRSSHSIDSGGKAGGGKTSKGSAARE